MLVYTERYPTGSLLRPSQEDPTMEMIALLRTCHDLFWCSSDQGLDEDTLFPPSPEYQEFLNRLERAAKLERKQMLVQIGGK